MRGGVALLVPVMLFVGKVLALLVPENRWAVCASALKAVLGVAVLVPLKL